MDGTSLERELEAVLHGTARHMQLLASTPHKQLQEAWVASSRPTLTAAAAKSVIKELRDNHISVRDAALWARLVRNGYLDIGRDPIRPIDIRWLPADEEKLAELTLAMDAFEEEDPERLEELLPHLLSSPGHN